MNDGESPAVNRRQTRGCSNTDATTRQCVTERKDEAALLLGEMGDTSGVVSRVKEEKVSFQGQGIFRNIQIKFTGVAQIKQLIRRGTQVTC